LSRIQGIRGREENAPQAILKQREVPMTRARVVAVLVSFLVLASAAGTQAAPAEQDIVLDVRVTLDAYRAAVDARLEGIARAVRLFAATDEARSGEWSRIRGPLAVLDATLPERAAVWFTTADGTLFTVERGSTGETLRDREYFPSLLEGRDVVGALVISKSTGMRSVIVASPVISDGKVTGSIGVSLDAVKLAAAIDQSIRFPPEVVFYVLDSHGRTALHRAGELIFVFPSDVGSPTLGTAVKTMLAQPEGVVRYQYAGSDKTAVFERSKLTGWVFVLGTSHPQN
jgi:methyl-accepting chemotaxis protein